MKTTPTTVQLFCSMSGFRRGNKSERCKMVMPTHEVYLPKDHQGTKRMAFAWGSLGTVEFADYGTGFWGGIPMGGGL